MTDYDLVYNFRCFEKQLNDEGFKVSTAKSAFFVHNSKGTIVADCKTVDGLRGFLQAIQYAKELE